MTKESITITKLTAGEGMVLTNGESFGREIYLGALDSPKNWKEVPENEAPKDDDAQSGVE